MIIIIAISWTQTSKVGSKNLKMLLKRVLWDLLKYKIRQFTINYSKTKPRDRRAKVNELEEKLQNCTEKCDKDPSKQNVEDLECLQAEYDQLYDYITQGAIVRSRATWYEKGEKNNKYFLNLEKSKSKLFT